VDGSKLYLNGINGATGQYLTPPVDQAAAAALARLQAPADPDLAADLRSSQEALRRPFMALPFGYDPLDVARVGWAVVYGPGVSAEARDALAPLLARRRVQVPPDRCKDLEVRAGEGMRAWLRRHGADVGKVSPTKVPYYLLLVADPEAVPFELQYLLDLDYAVGRLHFDTPGQYRQYADSVVAYETAGAAPHGKEVLYWGTRHPGDFPTRLSADSLITPLFEGVASDPDEGAPPAGLCGFRSRCRKGAGATKAALAEALGPGGPPPALLFTASHGLGWPRGDARQLPAQGALLCQDWTGFGSVRPEHYFAAADLAPCRVHGLVAFFFACFGAGTPRADNFAFGADAPAAGGPERLLADRPFVAALPQALLSHPQGGALAVLGHVERAWVHSFQPLDESFRPVGGVGPNLTMFRNCVARILSGEPVGHATREISEKYAFLSVQLLSLLTPAEGRQAEAERALVNAWIERTDAQNYVLLGDPAVRLRVDLLR
jgi:hypothetical protein